MFIHFGNQRYCKRIVFAQRLDDKLLCVVAYLQCLEGCNSHLGYRGNIGFFLVPYNSFRIQVLIFFMGVDGILGKSES